MNPEQRVRLELTPSQTSQIKAASGHEITLVELKMEQLEERIAPTIAYACTTGSHLPEVKI